MLLHLLRSTWHCTLQQSIALIRQHPHIFQYFITLMQTLLWFLEKVCVRHRSFSFYQILIRQYHNHLVHERREERLQTLLHSLMHNSIHNSFKLGIQQYTDIVITSTSLLTVNEYFSIWLSYVFCILFVFLLNCAWDHISEMSNSTISFLLGRREK